MQYLKGKSAVITGSSMGIGKAVALEFARQGANVVINSSSSRHALKETEQEIRSLGADVISCSGSVASFDFAGQLVERCVSQFGGIDILVNVAGIAEPHGSSILNMQPDAWQRQLDVHLTATFNTCRNAAPIMAERGNGCIINTASHSMLGIYGGSGYPAAKAGVAGFSWAIARDLNEYGIRCNAICPGAESRLSSGPDYEATIKSLNKRGILNDAMMSASLHPASPRYIAPLYVLLGSDLARDISGNVFSASGGYVGLFKPLSEQFLAYKDHENDELWELPELLEHLLNSQPDINRSLTS